MISEGTVVSGDDLSLLSFMAELERSSHKRITKKDERLQKLARPRYEDLLLSILLCNHALHVGPCHLVKEIPLDRLKSEGLVVIKQSDPTAHVRDNMAKAYEMCYDGYRELETNPLTRRFVSYEDLAGTESDSHDENLERRLRIEEAEDNIRWADEYLGTHINEVVNSLSSIFGYYFHAQVSSRFDSLVEWLSSRHISSVDIIKSPEFFGRSSGEQGVDVRRLMGLDPSSNTELDYEKPLPAFHPKDLKDLWGVESLLCTGSRFEDYMMRSLDLQLRSSPESRVWLIGFWSTYFELLNLLLTSQQNKCPLFLPADSRIESRNSRAVDTTSDLIAIYRIFLSERSYLPRLQTLEDLLRLRDDKRLKPLREVLRHWQEICRSDGRSTAETIRSEMSKAQSELRSVHKIQRAGRFIGYISLPVAVADAFLGSNIGLILSPIGPAVEIWSRIKAREFNWLQFGT